MARVQRLERIVRLLQALSRCHYATEVDAVLEQLKTA